MRIKRILGQTKQYQLFDGRVVSIEDYKAGRVPENKPKPVIENIEQTYKKKNRW
jgi:hypothetical protein